MKIELGAQDDPTKLLEPFVEKIVGALGDGDPLDENKAFNDCMVVAQELWDKSDEAQRQRLFCYFISYSAVLGLHNMILEQKLE